jgi:hypothetical protein
MGTEILTVALFWVLGTGALGAQTAPEPGPEVKEHLQKLIKQLPPESPLRGDLLRGAHGGGVHQIWMDNMRHAGIRRAEVWIDIRFDRVGKSKQMKVARAEYFTQYENGERINDPERLSSLRNAGIEQMLTQVALERAAHGYWVDVPHPSPHPFIGAAKIQLFDDEWLPTHESPLYCAGQGCLGKTNKTK